LARVQRVELDNARTYTVLDSTHLPVAPIREYLQFLRDDSASPNTIRAYAAGLAAWWTVLEHTGIAWDEFPASLFGAFLSYLRTGDLPGVARVGPTPTWLSPASVTQRSAAVVAFYRFHAAANGVDGPLQRLYSPHARRRSGRYKPMLTGIVSPDRDGLTYRNRSAPARWPPVLLPAQVQLILDSCSTWNGESWSGTDAGLRDRLLFATLAETGMRLGEALSLRHCDVHVGAGGTPRIDVTPRQDHPHGLRVKSGQPRRVYIGGDLEALYSAYVWQLVEACADLKVPDLGTHFVFVNVANGPRFAPMRPETVYAKVRSINRATGGQLPQGWTPHWLRHTHATALLLAGRPPHEIASLDATITTLTATDPSRAATGPGTQGHQPLLQIQTRGAHQSLLDQRNTPSTQ
jgi:site-specific recombinase XerD